MKKTISNLIYLKRLLSLFLNNQQELLVILLEEKNREIEFKSRELINLKQRISEYRLSFQDPDNDYRPNFIQEFPVNWSNDSKNNLI